MKNPTKVIMQGLSAIGVVLVITLAAGTVLNAEDWAQWRGSDRLGRWTETGIIDSFPAEGLQVKWRVPVRSGVAGPAVADGRVFILDWMEDPASRTLDGTERVVALDEETGDILWTHEWSTSYRMLMVSYAVGPRSTPTVDGDRVYVVGATGRFFCLDVEPGEVLWSKDYVAEYDTSIPTWGIASSPLVDGYKLITVVGGEPESLVMAFDKRTGEEIWSAVEVVGEMGYGQPVIYEAGGARQLIVWHASALVSLNPEDGEIYWEEEWEAGSGMSVTTPVKSGDYLLVSQFYNGSMMMRFNQDRPAASMLWKGSSRSEMPDETQGLHSLITTPLVIDDYIYGVGSYGELRGLDARTGERLWVSDEMTAQARWGAAFLVKHGDRYFVNNDDGFLMIAQFTPEGYVELDRTRLIEADGSAGIGNNNRFDRAINWSHPAYANKHIVHRNNTELIRVSLDSNDY